MYEEIRTKSPMSSESFMLLADQWAIDNGFFSDVTKNNILINLYTNFPKTKYVDYYLDVPNKIIEIHLHFSFWYLLFNNKSKIIKNCVNLINQYLREFTVIVEIEVYGKKTSTDNR